MNSIEKKRRWLYSANHRKKAVEFKPGECRLNNGGYVLVKTDKGIELEHRIVMAQTIGRCIDKNEVIHHINHDRADNRIENLLLLTKSEHDILTLSEL